MMTQSDDPPVVVGVEDTDAAFGAVRWGAVSALNHRAPLQLVYAAGFPDLYVGSTVPPPESFQQEIREQKSRLLERAQQTALELNDFDVQARFETDPPAPSLLHASRSAYMIVLGSSGHTGLIGTLVGSTTLTLATHAHCPVVSVRTDHPEVVADDRRPIVVGIDGSPLSERATGYAYAEASSRGVGLVAVHTWSDADLNVFDDPRMYFDWEPIRDIEERRLAERLAKWRERYPDVSVESVLVKDRPRHELLERSRSAQLVVVGSRGRGGFRGMLLGSTSQALIHHAACPVMIARPEGS